MLAAIGVDSQDTLFADIPDHIRRHVVFDHLPRLGLSEPELQQTQKAWAQANAGAGMACFLGGGAYYRFIPPAVHTIASRSEFYTAYTPYQPEIAQGTLQVTYEFQTMIAELTGMDVANAGVYDGASALTEAALMALRIRGGKKHQGLVVPRSLNPEYRAVLNTYLKAVGDVPVIEYDSPADLRALQTSLAGKPPCALLVQQPDYFGCLQDPAALQAFCGALNCLMVVAADPVSLGLLAPPGAYGADIVVGDIQPLGNNLAFGGPYGGFMACRSAWMRQLPGRLVGRTLDQNGTSCYTLTLQTREQHIRRDRATSNICTNQALNVLKATVYMTLVGPAGLKRVAQISADRAHALAEKLCRHDGVERVFADRPFLFEFAVRLPCPVKPLLAHLEQSGILAGIPLAADFPQYPDTLLMACTEMTTPSQIDQLDTLIERWLVSVGRKNGQPAPIL